MTRSRSGASTSKQRAACRSAGYTYDVETLVVWATAKGWYPDELLRLREYATGVLSGKRFVLRDTWGPSKGRRCTLGG